MLRKACFYIRPDSVLLNNQFFIAGTIGNKMKSDAYAFVALKAELLKYDIDLSTQDINPPEKSDLVFCMDQPHHISELNKKKNQIWCLIISEPVIYCPESWNTANHVSFDYVFTYNKHLVDNKKYFHYTFAIDTDYFLFPEPVTEELYNRRKLCTFVSSAMQGMPDRNNSNSLLFTRYEAVKWFGTNYPADFDFYGSSFKKNVFHWSFKGVSLFRKSIPQKLFFFLARIKQRKLIRVYGGTLAPTKKIEAIKNYNFYLCYENISGVNGYLTEKIFDCFYSSCVPVYWGAEDIEELIPYNCYINGADFNDFESLYKYIKNMPFDTYSEYVKEAQLFLRSQYFKKFTVTSFVEDIISPIKNTICEHTNF